ncbi:MAG: 5-methyltetrahydropteroyltriglutamate--homocysteine S-methyltransferase [Lacisediminihabitans sp.]
MSVNPPYRADIVGSFLRPASVATARARLAAREIDVAELARVEDAAIRTLVAREAQAGLRLATDGEFRRSWWHFDFFEMLDGVSVIELDHGIQFQGVQTRPRGLRLDGTVEFPSDHPTLEHFRFLKSVADEAGVTPKFSIPAPTVLDFRLEQSAFGPSPYSGHDDLFDDLAATYRAAVQAFYDAGCRYLQFDDTAWAYLCSDVELAKAAERGPRTEHLAERYASLITASLRDKPEDLIVTTHVCRGNFRSTWISSGGYEPVAEQLLGETGFDGYFLEYDNERAGGFEPLRFLPAGDQIVELGLITTKTGVPEDPEDLKRRINEAAEVVPLDQLAISPQCGFASTEEGNVLTEDEQWAKIEATVAVAEAVWG